MKGPHAISKRFNFQIAEHVRVKSVRFRIVTTIGFQHCRRRRRRRRP